MDKVRKPLRIAVLGASGRVGRVVIAEALSRGHRVTAVARSAEGLERVEGATRVTADVLDPVALRRAVSGHDAVIAALAGRGPQAARTVPEATAVLLDVLPGCRVGRLLTIGGGATLEVAPGRRFLDDPHFPEAYREAALAAAEALDVLRRFRGDLPRWSYFSPPPLHLTDGPRTGVFRVAATDRPIVDIAGESRLSVADLACAVLDAVEQGGFIGERFTAAY